MVCPEGKDKEIIRGIHRNMAGWDRGGIYYADLLAPEPRDDSDRILRTKCSNFLADFRIEHQFVYRDQLRRNIGLRIYYLVVEVGHVQAFDDGLATALQKRPADILEMLEGAARELARSICVMPEDTVTDPLADLQVQLGGGARPMAVRELSASNIGRLVRVPGIVVSASTAVARPTRVLAVCRSCHAQRRLVIPFGFGGVSLPRNCPGQDRLTDAPQTRCPPDPFVLMPERCTCVDQQTLKLQEAPDMVPVGELPRHVLLTVDRYLVNKISPGTRLIVTGVYSIFQAAGSRATKGAGVAVRTPYIRVVGIQQDMSGGADGNTQRPWIGFTEEDERRMIAFSRQPDLYSRFCQSIGPSIFGNEDIKKAIACLLFGGSRKLLPDRIRLRGDINVLLLGDPGTAKSQFLKFVERVAPIAVYTSGKGSSAAGLTASVIRDPSSGDFYLEGGAMVLADGGVVCIDEFDKMNDEDRVAIHEAMEQQTISIAKAGITTILNSRTAVLAAANPVFGRYDELRTPGENIDFSTTILSRFDMIFIIKDDHNIQRDMTMAKHVLSVHMNAEAIETTESGLDLATMKSYIAYCKAKCAPRLSPEAAEKLSSHYVAIRSEVHRLEQNAAERSSIPITIRQLEAIVRIAESLAKMTLSPVATELHIEEALRLFKVSTMQAVLSGHTLEGMTRPDLIKEIEKVEKAIRQRMAIGVSVSYRALVDELCSNRNFTEHSVVRTIDIMVQQEKLALKNQRKVLVRQR